jgi:hypothetical protein
MDRKLSQKDAVLKHIEKYGSLTQREASKALGVDRLPARVSDINDILSDPARIKYYGWERFDGRRIVPEYIYVTNRYGNKTRIARYRLNAEDGLEDRGEA